MNIIEKQGAVTRLITAIQNRMLKETWLTWNAQHLPGFKENGLPEGSSFWIPPPKVSRMSRNLQFLTSHFSSNSHCQELRAAVLKAEQVQLQPNEYPARDP